MTKKITTVEELATMTQEEFLATGKTLDAITGTLHTVVDTLDLIRADVHDIKLTLGPLVRQVAVMEEKV